MKNLNEKYSNYTLIVSITSISKHHSKRQSNSKKNKRLFVEVNPYVVKGFFLSHLYKELHTITMNPYYYHN